MVPDAPMHYACDKTWWNRYYDEVKAGFSGESYTINDQENPRNNPDPAFDLNRVDSYQRPDFGLRCIHYGIPGGGNSGFQAANLAFLKGAGTIILLGMDCFGSHYFGSHPTGLSNGSPYPSFIQSWESITADVEIINCSRQTALTCFERKSIDELI